MSGFLRKKGIEVISKLDNKPKKSVVKVFLNICSEAAGNKSCQLTVRDIAAMTSLSTRSVQFALADLVERGVLTRVLIPQEGSVFTVNMDGWGW